jgi:hypothetical protein
MVTSDVYFKTVMQHTEIRSTVRYVWFVLQSYADYALLSGGFCVLVLLGCFHLNSPFCFSAHS